MFQTVVLRHSKERLSKCSLQPLVGRGDIKFIKYKLGLQVDGTGYILLSPDGEELSRHDIGKHLLILDSTWRLLPDLEACVIGEPVKRSLPRALRTAYPRVSKISEDPLGGLASVEALYAAWRLLGYQDDSLLDGYHWKDKFLSQYED